MADPPRDGRAASVREAMHLEIDGAFSDVLPFVQLEHEYIGFETVKVTRLDEMIRGSLGDTVPPTALLVMCHSELARDALAIDPRLGAILPCTTIVYERSDDDHVHVHHLSTMKAMRDLGGTPEGSEQAMADLITRSGELMRQVWNNIESNVDLIE